ncbi:MAG: hypothetical protein M1819_001775 [Sarea resinae]|nr:MAG: hypothetical protein M1819_001775 [Sarea resinae]
MRCSTKLSIIVPSIHHPSAGPQAASAAPLILYLPRGPILPNEPSDGHDVEILAEASRSTIVRIKYRLDRDNQYPTSIHDVLTAYDWVVDNLIDAHQKTLDRHAASRRARVGVCGELIGGSLATMLALTECRLGRPRIAAASVTNPIVDWIFPERTPVADDLRPQPIDLFEQARLPRKKGRPAKAPSLDSWTAFAQTEPLTAEALLSARSTCFAHPEHYFDTFASPILFLRSAGVDPPFEDRPTSPYPSENDPAVSNASERGEEKGGNEVDESTSKPMKRRKAPRRFPPLGSGLSLPATRISLGLENPLRDQGLELARFLRRSVARDDLQKHGLELLYDVGDDDDDRESAGRSSAAAEQRIQVVDVPGQGLLHSHLSKWEAGWHGADEEMEQIGLWFRHAL